MTPEFKWDKDFDFLNDGNMSAKIMENEEDENSGDE